MNKKIEDLKTIIISTENKSISFRLNNGETKANLIIDDFITNEFIVNKKNVLLKSFKKIDIKNEAFDTINTSELFYNILLKLKNILENGAGERYFTTELLNNNLFKNLEIGAIKSVVNKSLTYAKLLTDTDNSEFEENQPLGKVAQLLSIIDDFHNNSQYILRIGQEGKNKNNIILELINIDPSVALSKIADSHSTTIMMSGTFSPIDFYELYYFGKNEKVEKCSLPNSFPKQNRLIIGINDVNTFKGNRDDKINYEKCIDTFITDIPGNIALFFTSYQMKIDYNRYCNEITKRNKKEFFDQKSGITDGIFENFKNAAKNKGGVLMAVAGGALSEGKDYRGDALQGAMMIGFPLIWNDFQKMKNAYFIGRYGVNNGDFIANKLPAMNKALQALGRVIRDRDETGILILADNRFTKEDKYSVRQYLPSWIKNEMIICNSLQIGDIIRNWIKNTELRKNRPLIEEIEKLQMKSESLKKDIENHEKKYDVLNGLLKKFENEFTKNSPLFDAIEQKNRWNDLMQEKKKLLIENEQLRLTIKQIETDNAPFNDKLKILKEEFKNIEPTLKYLTNYIDCIRLYKANRSTVDNYPKYYPSITKNAKLYGILGKSSSELNELIELKEKDLNPITEKERNLRLAIENENDFLNKNSSQYSNSIEKLSSNDKCIVDIQLHLNSIDIHKIEEIDENTTKSLRVCLKIPPSCF